MNGKILLVDDDPELHELVRFVLMRDGYDVADAFDAAQGLEMLARDDYALALLDVMMPGMNGLQLLEKLRATRPRLPVILMTAATLSHLFDAAPANCTLLAKPFDIEDLRHAVKQMMNAE